jgi:hypothetical protein
MRTGFAEARWGAGRRIGILEIREVHSEQDVVACANVFIVEAAIALGLEVSDYERGWQEKIGSTNQHVSTICFVRPFS